MGEYFRELPKESKPGDSHTADFEGYTIDVFKLIELSKEIAAEEIDIQSLEKFRQNCYWHDRNGNWISPGEIIDEAEKHEDGLVWDNMAANRPEWEDEIRKIQAADYKSYPIILIGNYVIDGIHRLTKAWIDGVNTLQVKRFPALPEETIISK